MIRQNYKQLLIYLASGFVREYGVTNCPIAYMGCSQEVQDEQDLVRMTGTILNHLMHECNLSRLE